MTDPASRVPKYFICEVSERHGGHGFIGQIGRPMQLSNTTVRNMIKALLYADNLVIYKSSRFYMQLTFCCLGIGIDHQPH